MKILRVGDPHVRVSNIDESDLLLSMIAGLAIKHSVDRIEILGDLFHTHAILRLEVLEFWTNALEHLSDICEVVVLVGNHDQTGDYNSQSSALDIFSKLKIRNLKIAEYPLVLGPIAYISYIHDPAKFVSTANALAAAGAKALVCHQTFNGSKFESGMYAPDGIDPDLINFDVIISGHIHAQQRFGKVIYPGTARWDTASDANQPKGLWIFEHNDITGSVVKETFFSTENVCKPIISLSYKEGDTVLSPQDGARVSIELIGSSVWCAQEKEKLKGKCSVKTKITDRKQTNVRKAGDNFEQFMSNLFVSTMDKDSLLKYAKELGVV